MVTYRYNLTELLFQHQPDVLYPQCDIRENSEDTSADSVPHRIVFTMTSWHPKLRGKVSHVAGNDLESFPDKPVMSTPTRTIITKKLQTDYFIYKSI